MTVQRMVLTCVVLGLLLVFGGGPGMAQEQWSPTEAVPQADMGTAFTYQGRLETASGPVSGTCDLVFRLYGSAAGTDQIGAELTRGAVAVADGYLTVNDLDFGAGAFGASERWLEIQVRCPAGSGAYATLSPRQRLTPAPQALFARTANLVAYNPLDTAAIVKLDWLRIGTVDWPRIRYGGEGSGATNGFLIQGQGDTTKLAVLHNGNVGIGTASPTARLHVVADDNRWAMYLSGGPVFSNATLVSKWNLNPADNGSARMPIISANWDTSSGLGFLHGSNMHSPVIWMYSYSGNNAFTVAKKGYAGTGSDVTDIEDWLTPLFQVRVNGRVGIGTVDPQAKLDVAGTTRTDTLQIDAGSDLAEPFGVAGAENVAPGMVMAIDPENAGQLRIAVGAYDRTVAGCVSGANGVRPGLIMSQEGSAADGEFPVALSGRVYCLADARHGPIRPGDLLTTSDTPGHAMAVVDYGRAQGAILGKAMTGLDEGQGYVLVLVTLQ